MWLLDNLYPQRKEIKKKNISKFNVSSWSMKYYLKVDKFSQTGVLCSNGLSKFEVKLKIYRNMIQVVKAARDNYWTICHFSLIRDVQRLHNIEFEHYPYR